MSVNNIDTKQIISIYLKEIDQLKLLSRDGETEIFTNIATAYNGLVHLVLNSESALKCLTSAADALIKGELKKDQLFVSTQNVAGSEDLEGYEEDTTANKLAAHLISLCYDYKSTDSTVKHQAFCKISEIKFADSLFQRIAESIRHSDFETTKEILALVGDIRELKHMVIERNLKLVAHVAKGFKAPGFEFEDLVSEGNFGLIKAVDLFNYEKGHKFSTYAHWWIRQTIGRAIADSSRLIRVPVHLVETINQVAQGISRLATKLGREPSAEELAVELNLPLSKVTKALTAVQNPTSIDSSFMEGDENSKTLHSVIADESEEGDPEYHVERDALLKIIDEVFETLTEREVKVVRLRLGFASPALKAPTYAQLSKLMGYSAEGVRQIELSTYKKIKDDEKFAVRLKEFFQV